MSPKRSASSREWLKEHFTDTYVKQAHKGGYRSRSIFKLEEIQQRDRLFLPGMTVIELGAAPGGWSQLLCKLLGKKGRVIAVDILPMEPLPQIEFILGDFNEEAVRQQISTALKGAKVDWVISDMAPNLSGISSVDQGRSMVLAEMALEFTLETIHEDGGFLIKAFQGEGYDLYLKSLRHYFKKIVIRKPKASRGRSREVYIVARGRK